MYMKLMKNTIKFLIKFHKTLKISKLGKYIFSNVTKVKCLTYINFRLSRFLSVHFFYEIEYVKVYK